MHKPIIFSNVALTFADKVCFTAFSTTIHAKQRIAIIGRNGSGKSCLLKLIAGKLEPSAGSIYLAPGMRIGYVAQILEQDKDAQNSGSQRFFKAFTQALALQSDVLLLDEPTNHLDVTNRQSLLRALCNFSGTLIVATHDPELLDSNFSQLWHINHEQITLFHGRYAALMQQQTTTQHTITQQIGKLKRQQQQQHLKLMQEQQRASKRKAYGQKTRAGDKLSLRHAQAVGQSTTNSRHQQLAKQQQQLTQQLAHLQLSEEIIPTFSLTAGKVSNKLIITISNGYCGYTDTMLLHNLNFTLTGNARAAIVGRNGCGKTTLLKAILQHPAVVCTGNWQLPNPKNIGYLDQHYQTPEPQQSVLQTIASLAPSWSHAQLRTLLNRFLFRTNAQVNAMVTTLSGGERARLALAVIAVHTPQLLLLDEITNNLDLETREHVIQVLRAFPAALLVVSHDQRFLEEIGIQDIWQLDALTTP